MAHYDIKMVSQNRILAFLNSRQHRNLRHQGTMVCAQHSSEMNFRINLSWMNEINYKTWCLLLLGWNWIRTEGSMAQYFLIKKNSFVCGRNSELGSSKLSCPVTKKNRRSHRCLSPSPRTWDLRRELHIIFQGIKNSSEFIKQQQLPAELLEV